MALRIRPVRRDATTTKAPAKKPPLISFGFTGTNPDAQRAASTYGATRVTDISLETEAALRAVIARAIREGIPPYEAARTVRSMVGMTTRQAMAAMNYRAGLIEAGHSIDRVNGLVDRYTAKKVRERADMIARTETMEALNRGQQEAWEDAQREGLLPEDAKKAWMTTPGCCDDCEQLDGVEVALDDEFPQGGGDGPPLHPNCRCAVAPA